MKIDDFRKLKKLMMMTMSGADQEKLVAINRANALLAAEGVDWDRVLERMVTLEVEDGRAYEPENDKTEAERIDEAFEAIEADDPRGSFADFIASLKDQWDKNRSLSDKQKASLFRSAEQARRR